MFDYMTLRKPVDSFRAGFTLGQIRFYDLGGYTYLTNNTYAFPFINDNWMGDTDRHNKLLYC